MASPARDVEGWNELTPAARRIISEYNIDDALVKTRTKCDGVDLTTIAEIESEESVDYWRADTMLSGPSIAERKIFVCIDSDGHRHKFYHAVQGSPDGVWCEMSTNKSSSKLLGNFQ